MRIARSTGVMCGLAIALLGVWGALIPFVGPYFDYSFGVNSTWHYTSDRLWLDILPGAAAVLGGVLLVLASTRPAGVVGGWLALAGGAWYAIGPAVSLTWESGQGPIGRPLFGSTRQMLELLGYFYGLGALIIALSAFAIGRFVSRPPLAGQDAIASASRVAAPTSPAPAPALSTPPPAHAPDPSAPTPDGEGRSRRRFGLRGRVRFGRERRPGSAALQ